MDLTETQMSQMDRALADTTTSAPFDGALVQLYQTDIPILPSTPLATFTAAIATYSGYSSAGALITWETPTLTNDNQVEVVGTVPIFRPTSSLITNGIFGLYITDSTGARLYFAGRFDTAPIGMDSAFDKIIVTVRYRPASKSMVAYID